MYKSLFVLLAMMAIYGKVIAQHPVTLDEKIIGGQDASIEDFPYQVSVRKNDAHTCGGSIIKARVVLTAAHCVFNTHSSNVSIRYGSAYVNSGRIVAVQRIRTHESYNSFTYDNDVALLFLAEDIQFGSIARPISLASAVPETGTRVVVSGWGARTERGFFPAVLQKVDLEIVDNRVCAEQYAGSKDITDRMLCAGVVGGKGDCRGDSGGPLVAYGVQFGIVSWAIGCARANYPGVYANVANLRSWIEENLY